MFASFPKFFPPYSMFSTRRPSGNAADDQAAHDVTNVHHRLKSIQTDLLDDIKKENDELRSRVNELQSSIERGEREISSVSINKLDREGYY